MTNEIESLANDRSKANKPFADHESVKYWAWLIRGILIAVIAVALFYARTEYRFSKIEERLGVVDKTFAERKTSLDTFSSYIISNNIANSAANNTIENLRDRMTALESWKNIIDPEHKEMWFMKSHGISNKDDFFQKHGYTAPEGAATKGTNP